MQFESSDSILWMLADSALPTGGFVASAALEVAFQIKHITSTKSLIEFINQNIHSYGHSAGITTICTYSALPDDEVTDVADTLKRIGQIDAFYDACTTNHIAKRASKTQGSAYLTLITKSFMGEKESAVIKSYKQLVRVS